MLVVAMGTWGLAAVIGPAAAFEPPRRGLDFALVNFGLGASWAETAGIGRATLACPPARRCGGGRCAGGGGGGRWEGAARAAGAAWVAGATTAAGAAAVALSVFRRRATPLQRPASGPNAALAERFPGGGGPIC